MIIQPAKTQRYVNRTPGCVDDMLKVLHWESLEMRRKNNRLSLLHKINTDHVDITLDQYLQRSDPRTWGAQRFRHARADHPALYHLFFHATLRQWNRLPTILSATVCPEAFRTGLWALTSALIFHKTMYIIILHFLNHQRSVE